MNEKKTISNQWTKIIQQNDDDDDDEKNDNFP